MEKQTTVKTTTTTNKGTKKGMKKNGNKKKSNGGSAPNIIINATSPQHQRSGRASTTVKKNSNVVTHREIFLTVVGTLVNGLIVAGSMTHHFHFGNDAKAITDKNWLGRFGMLWDKYKIKKLKYSWQPVLPHIVGGAGLLRWDPDPYNSAEAEQITFESESANQNAKSESIYLKNNLEVQKNQFNRLPWFLVTPGGNVDKSVGEAGNLNFTWSNVSVPGGGNAADVTMGFIWAEYEVEFQNPSQNTSRGPIPPTPPIPPAPTPAGGVIQFRDSQNRVGTIASKVVDPNSDDNLRNGTPFFAVATETGGILTLNPFSPPSLKECGMEYDTKYTVGFTETVNGIDRWTPAIWRRTTDGITDFNAEPQFDVRGIEVSKSDADSDNTWWTGINFLKGPQLDRLTEEEEEIMYNANWPLPVGQVDNLLGLFSSPTAGFNNAQVNIGLKRVQHEGSYVRRRHRGNVFNNN